MSATSWEDIERLSRFCKAYRERRPNSPIVRGVKSGDGDPIHLDIADLELLVEQAKEQLPLRDRMRFTETQLWAYDPKVGGVVAIRTKVESRTEACL